MNHFDYSFVWFDWPSIAQNSIGRVLVITFAPAVNLKIDPPLQDNGNEK